MVIVRVRPTGKDRYGDRIDGTPDRHTLEGAFTAPADSFETHEHGRDSVVTGIQLFAKYGADVLATDQVEVDGILYDVEGDVQPWKNPLTGRRHGSTARLKRATG